MAIEEKQRALEFTFVPDDIEGDLKYDITYDDSNPVFPLQISTGGNRTDYPLDLFVDVVEFLTNKGVIQPKSYAKTAVMHTPTTVHNPAVQSFAPTLPPTSIPVPQVMKQGGSAASATLTANTDPLASFDIAGVSSPPTPELVQKMHGATPPIPSIVKSGEEGIVMHSPAQVSIMPTIPSAPSPASSEMISRPVIRSRVTGGDPKSAEAEAAMIRAQAGKGAGKTIRKAHRTEE